MENAYASALLALVEKGTPAKDAVAKVREALERNGRLSIMPRVGRAFARLAGKKARAKTIVALIAREEDRKIALAEAERFAAGKAVEVRLDPTLVGGWRIEGGGKVLDASHKKDLLSIYDRSAAGL